MPGRSKSSEFDGNDTISGGGGRDTLFGGFGNDAIQGGTDRDRMLGEEGDDDLYANDDLWEDNVHGGPGFDHADIDDDPIVEDDTTSVEDEDD